MEKHIVIVGWGYETEERVLETENRKEAVDLYEELHLRWFDHWQHDDIDSDNAKEERPYHVIECENGEFLEYW